MINADERAARLAIFEEVVRIQASDLDIRRQDERNALRAGHPWKVGIPSLLLTGIIVFSILHHLTGGEDNGYLFLLIIGVVVAWSVVAFLVRAVLIFAAPWARPEHPSITHGDTLPNRMRKADFRAAKQNAARAIQYEFDCPVDYLSEDERERVRRRIEAINRLDLESELFTGHEDA